MDTSLSCRHGSRNATRIQPFYGPMVARWDTLDRFEKGPIEGAPPESVEAQLCLCNRTGSASLLPSRPHLRALLLSCDRAHRLRFRLHSGQVASGAAIFVPKGGAKTLAFSLLVLSSALTQPRNSQERFLCSATQKVFCTSSAPLLFRQVLFRHVCQ